MPSFGDFSNQKKKKQKKEVLEKKAKKELNKSTYILPKVEIIGRKKDF